jgi:hypothetical protein
LFKKQPFKTPKISAETQTKDSLFYEVCWSDSGVPIAP